jgi:DNA replication protein DnaC
VTVETLLELPSPGIQIPTLKDTENRLLIQRDPTAQITLANCVTCWGRKTFRWYLDASRTDIGTFRCPCESQYLLYKWMLNSGIRKQYQRLGWTDLVSLDDSVKGPLNDFLSNSEWYLDSGHGLIINGEKGNGKSLLAYLLLKSLIAKGTGVYATTFADMVSAFTGGWDDKEQERWFERTVRNARVLYIDDLGREYKSKAQATGMGSPGERMLEAVIRSRVASDQTTIITTNLKRDQIEQGYGGHTMSLLTECSEILTVPGTEDWRPRKAEWDRTEIREQLTRPIVLA